MKTETAKNRKINSTFRCKRDRTRCLLIEAAIEVLSEQGLEGVSIDDLMRGAGMARGTFYNYFQSREELAQAVSNYIREKIHQSIVDNIPESYSAEQTFACATYGFIYYGLQYPKTGWALVRIGGSNHWVSEERLSRARHALQKVMPDHGQRSYPGLVYVEGVALMVLRRLLEKAITQDEADFIVELAMRGMGIHEANIKPLLNLAKEFVANLHI